MRHFRQIKCKYLKWWPSVTGGWGHFKVTAILCLLCVLGTEGVTENKSNYSKDLHLSWVVVIGWTPIRLQHIQTEQQPLRQSELLKTTLYHRCRTWFFRSAFISAVESFSKRRVLQIRQVPHFCLPRLCHRGGGAGWGGGAHKKGTHTSGQGSRGAGAVSPRMGSLGSPWAGRIGPVCWEESCSREGPGFPLARRILLQVERIFTSTFNLQASLRKEMLILHPKLSGKLSANPHRVSKSQRMKQNHDSNNRQMSKTWFILLRRLNSVATEST